MPAGPTIGVLSTSFGGSYFGGLMGAVTGALAEADGRLVAIQTLDAGTFAVDVTTAPPFPHRVAWDHVAGFIVILNAVNTDYLRAIRASGRPVVIISDTPEDFTCPLILPDNHSGVKEATEHLITRHGHTRIGFMGHLGQQDARERYEAYRQTMLEQGLTPRQEWFFDTGDMQETGGEHAARAILDADLPVTAVVTGNDQNAIGAIRVLSQAGVDLPNDLAVIGFDDTEEGANLTPNLTSVRQPLEEIGAMATRLLLKALAGEEVRDGVYHVATALTVRESCGCAWSVPAFEIPEESGQAEPGEEIAIADDMLLESLTAVLGTRLLDEGRFRDEIRTATRKISETLHAAGRADGENDTLELRQALAPLSAALNGYQNVINATMRIEEHAQQLQVQAMRRQDMESVARIERRLHQIMFVLGQLHSAQQAHHAKSMMLSLATQYLISMELLRSQESDPRSLDWLRLTEARGGCLGLWAGEVGSRTLLDIAGTYVPSESWAGADGRIAVTSFPPPALVEMADVHRDEMIYVSHLKVGTGDWGMLAIVGPVQATVQQGRETMNQWSALLSVALEHEAVLKTMREQEEHLRRAALYDELTGLPNRAFFRDRLRVAMARTQRRAGYLYAVMMLDLDGFKLVNDSLGHLAGDDLLQQVATRIVADLRRIDTAARFGGDEFAVLLEEIPDLDAAVTMANRLQERISASYTVRGHEVVVSASIGIAVGEDEYRETEEIIRDADAAMYQVKTRGKCGYAIFDPSMHTAAMHRLRLEGELRRGLEDGELELHYQPIVELDSGLVSGAEALCRWRHPTRGLIAPGEFLPVAQESGLILGIGDWVLEEACRQLGHWCVSPCETPFMMSINVSDRQFWQGSLIQDLERCFSALDLDPRCLAVEITEGVIMHDVKEAADMLGNLHALGLQVHIDDFGTGYSSLEVLHDLPLDALKIDRSFVSRLTVSDRSRELVRTIVTMGRNLGLDVIAEGIETESELALARELGCTHGQGYLFSRPVPAQDLEPQIGTRPLGPVS